MYSIPHTAIKQTGETVAFFQCIMVVSISRSTCKQY